MWALADGAVGISSQAALLIRGGRDGCGKTHSDAQNGSPSSEPLGSLLDGVTV